jgi:hypothetical protein
MPLSDRDRKILWGRSGQRCAICNRELVVGRTSHDREAVVGDEAHIVSPVPGGPRFRPLEGVDPDGYANRILLCKVDHKRVDDQPGEYPEDTLLKIKREHEEWVAKQLGGDVQLLPIRLRFTSPEPTFLKQLHSGSDVWNVFDGADSYLFPALDEGEGFSSDECDLGDAFLDEARDSAEISDEIADYGLSHVRGVKRALGEHVSSLNGIGLAVFGGRRQLRLTGGRGSPIGWWEAILIIRRKEPTDQADTFLKLVNIGGVNCYQVVRPEGVDA